MAKVHASYYTDPLCPWSWAMEPALRGLRREFGEEIEWTFVMGGLAREVEAESGRILEWLEAGDRGAMPVDPRIWSPAHPPARGSGAGPRSSYPACIAVKAAAEQGDPSRYLRRLREGLLARRRKLDTTEALVEEGRAVDGLDVERFRIDLASNWTVERFGADLELAAAAGERAAAVGTGVPASSPSDGRRGRVPLPSIEFAAPGGERHAAYGFSDLATLRAAALAAGAEPMAQPPLGVEEALTRLGALAPAEVAALCDLPGPRASAELWRLALEWRVRPERVLTGELWTIA